MHAQVCSKTRNCVPYTQAGSQSCQRTFICLAGYVASEVNKAKYDMLMELVCIVCSQGLIDGYTNETHADCETTATSGAKVLALVCLDTMYSAIKALFAH